MIRILSRENVAEKTLQNERHLQQYGKLSSIAHLLITKHSPENRTTKNLSNNMKVLGSHGISTM